MKIKGVKKITNCVHLNMFEISYFDCNNDERSWQIACRTKEPKCINGQFSIPDGVIIVPFHKKKNRLVIIKEFRVAVGDYLYGFPAGLIDGGETIEQAAERELKEETGLNVTCFNKVGPPVFSSTGMTDESVSMVFVECDGEPTSENNKSSEEIDTIFVSSQDATALCEDSTLKFDVKTWLVLSSFAESEKVWL